MANVRSVDRATKTVILDHNTGERVVVTGWNLVLQEGTRWEARGVKRQEEPRIRFIFCKPFTDFYEVFDRQEVSTTNGPIKQWVPDNEDCFVYPERGTANGGWEAVQGQQGNANQLNNPVTTEATMKWEDPSCTLTLEAR